MYQRITLAGLLTRLEERVGNNAVFWSAAEGQDAINEAIKIWQAATGEWNKKATLTLTSGTAIYDVPRQITSLARVGTFATNALPATATWLPKIDLYSLDYGFPEWQGTSGTPEFWAPLGLNKIVVYPNPTTGAFLLLDGFAEAPELHTSSDFIDIGSEEVVRLVDYAQWYLSFKEGVNEGVNTPEPLLGQFYAAAILRNSRLQAFAAFRRYLGEDQAETLRRPRAGEVTAPGVRKLVNIGAQ